MDELRTYVERVVEVVRQTLAQRNHPPESTYRLQLQAGQMTFQNVTAIIPYLHELGISHVYLSPCMKATMGSPHGYDVVDYRQLNPELGTAEDHAAMVESLHAHGMGAIQDIVPNHMGIYTAENVWWNDVLENGPNSPHAACFDIDWHPVKAELDNKVLLPFLGDQYGKVLESGQLQLEYADGAFSLRYFQRRLPLDPRTYPVILAHRLDELKKTLGDASDELRELESILTALDYLPAATDANPDRVAERQREKEVIKGRLRRLTAECPAVAGFIQQNLAEFNGTVGDAHSFDRLDDLLNLQNYRLAHWKAAGDEVNYRRFFDINDLAAVSTEEPQVFDLIHQLPFDLLARGAIDGLRVDHIDGLYDPEEYLWRLQWGYVRSMGRAAFERIVEQSPETTSQTDGEVQNEPPTWEMIERQVVESLWREIGGPAPPGFVPEAPATNNDDETSGDKAEEKSDLTFSATRLPAYVVVEKILGPDEPLPPEWPVAGTTGYDFLNQANRLFVDRVGLGEIAKIYQRFTGERTGFREVSYQARLLILRVAMSSELQLLAHRVNRISERSRLSRDFTLNSLRLALREILTCFPVYRTYICRGRVSDRDRLMIQRAVAQAKRRNPARDPAVFDFIRDVLLLEQPPILNDADRRERDLFVGRFQQVTSPLVAKGVEDTAFYQHFPLASLNEVGGDPDKGASTVAEFHYENRERLQRRAGSLITTSTHDTKRSEDVRARINILSEVPQWWRSAVNRWARLNRRHRREVDGLPAPSRNDEYLFYQTLLGAWPIEPLDESGRQDFVERMQSYMEKATREAKQRTSWVSPNLDYDAAVSHFVAAALDDQPKNRFLAEFRAFEERILDCGLYSALSQALLKLTSPGVPDIYQGQELWEFWLVDPDNRRPVDFARRQYLLKELQTSLASDASGRLAMAQYLAQHPRDNRLKLFTIWQALQFRRRRPNLFRHGRYEPLAVEGEAAEHVAAFAWQWTPPDSNDEQRALVVVPRLLAKLALRSAKTNEAMRPPLGETVWGDTRLILGALQPGPMKNLFTGQTLQVEPETPLAGILSDFPVALLANVD